MTKFDLERELLEIFRTYWRIRAGLALFRQHRADNPDGDLPLGYQNVPVFGNVSGPNSGETIDAALDSVASYERDRLITDVFLLLISRFEQFLSHQSVQRGGPRDGTLGSLQTSCQQLYSLIGTEITLTTEVRERRNSWIHNHGLATAKYVVAATAASVDSMGNVSIVAVGDSVVPTERYLPYATDVLIRYGRMFP